MIRDFYATALAAGLLATMWIALPLCAKADQALTGEEILAAVSDHSYQGSMSKPGSVFVEYYAPDGSIRAVAYSGQLRAEDGAMCFQYGDKPERCFGVTIEGPSMVMYKDGQIDGNGMLIPGNPNDF